MPNTTIYKYPFYPIMDMPKGAEILHFGEQQYARFIWALVDPEAELEPRYFTIHGTGQNVQPTEHHVSTWLDGPFVWHLFEVKPR